MLDFWVQFGLKIPLILYCGVNFVKKYRWCHVGVQFLAKNCIDVTLLVKILPEKNCIVIVVLLRTHIAMLCSPYLRGSPYSSCRLSSDASLFFLHLKCFHQSPVQDDVYSIATISAAQGRLYHRFLDTNYSKHCRVKMVAMYNLSWYLKKKNDLDLNVKK